MIDFVVIGAGIAGASAAFFLVDHGKVVLLERESAPGYHTTGRSAALFTENYGNPTIRALTVASRPFFEAPPAGFADHALLHQRGALTIAPRGDRATFDKSLAEGKKYAKELFEVSTDEARKICPVLDPEWLGYAHFEPGAMDMDVHAIHQGYLKTFKARGGTLVTDAEVTSVARDGAGWRVVTRAGDFHAKAVINAAGAWADVIGAMAGVRQIGLVPKRRTAFTIDVPADAEVMRWPMASEVTERFYFKPEAGRVLCSLADETPSEPCDAQPEEIDVATAAARVEEATILQVQRITHKWAGLRSFVKDKTIVAGKAPDTDGFYWLAGQGGYGIMTSPTMGRMAAALATSGQMPADLVAAGVTTSVMGPSRLWK